VSPAVALILMWVESVNSVIGQACPEQGALESVVQPWTMLVGLPAQ
jgi:hypothetical protein